MSTGLIRLKCVFGSYKSRRSLKSTASISDHFQVGTEYELGNTLAS